ncbi:hypothetical protein FHG87_006041 [Trinorchestia longiramus]|nr:hypothetical protein FHG87_006041 [Trinorchestia longiramus]
MYTRTMSHSRATAHVQHDSTQNLTTRASWQYDAVTKSIQQRSVRHTSCCCGTPRRGLAGATHQIAVAECCRSAVPVSIVIKHPGSCRNTEQLTIDVTRIVCSLVVVKRKPHSCRGSTSVRDMADTISPGRLRVCQLACRLTVSSNRSPPSQPLRRTGSTYLKRALRMESPTPRLNESNLKKLSRGFRSSKKSRLSAASDVESCSVQDGAMPGRSASLSTLLPSGAPGAHRRPRVDKLQTVEAKMASIEVSLGSRKRREALLETLPRAARELVRELDSLQQAIREKDSAIHSLKTQVTALGGSASCDSLEVPTLGRIPDTVSALQQTGVQPVLTSAERKRVENRLTTIHKEIDSKRIAVKNLKLTLDNLDTTDNIDVRIRAAEVEYELEREELNILNLREEATVLEARLREPQCSSQFFSSQSNGCSDLQATESLSSLGSSQILQSSMTSSPESHQNFQCITSVAPQGRANEGNSISIKDILQDPECLGPVISSLVSVRMLYNPKNPAFRISASSHSVGCVVDWATDDTRLKRGDKLVEVNGRLVLGVPVQIVLQLIAMQAFMDIVVIRIISSASAVSGTAGSSQPSLSSQRRLERQLEDRTRELKETKVKLDKALREKETTKNDMTRLTHRISYLEDQVAELETATQKGKGSSENSATSSSSSSPAPCSSGTTVIQVYQKGQHTLAVASSSSDSLTPDDLSKKYPSPHSRGNDDATRLGPSARRTSSSSSKSSGHNPSCDSSSSGYSSYPSLKQPAAQEDHEASKDVFDAPESLLPNTEAEQRRSRRVISPSPDFRSLVDSQPSHRMKPVPPKKPERLSLQRTTSLLSVDQASSCSSHSSKHRTSGHRERFHSSSGWKSIGDGLNTDFLESECEVSSQVSGRISVSSYRSDVIHNKRRSRTYRDFEVSRTSSTSTGYALSKRRQPDHFPRDMIMEDSLGCRDSSIDRRRRKSDVKSSRPRDSWSSGTKNDFLEQSYNYCPLDRNSTYQIPLSGKSSSNMSGKSDYVEVDNALDETISQNSYRCRFDDRSSNNSNFDDRSQSTTPTNSPLKFTTSKKENEPGDVERCVSPKSISEISSSCEMPAIRTEAKKTLEYSKSDELSKVRSNGVHKPQTLSSIHNQKNYLSRDVKNRFNATSGNPESRSDILPPKFNAFASSNPRQSKENYPANLYTYGCKNFTSENFSSLKRHTGRNIASNTSTAPSTPLTPRSTSAMKLTSAASGPEDWC